MKNKRITLITISVLLTFILVMGVAGCNTSCNKKIDSSLVPTSTETKTITGEVIATSEVDGSKVVIIETEIDGVKVTETSVVNTSEEITIGETITVTTTTTTTNGTVDNTTSGTTSNGTTNTSGTTTNGTSGTTTTSTTTTSGTTTTTTTTTQATPTPKPNYNNNDIDFGNDESAASEYQNNNGGTVETTTPPTNTPKPTNTPVPTATPEPTATPTPEPTATPTPEPTEAPKETDPEVGYAIIKVVAYVTVYVDDESTDTYEVTKYYEIEGYTYNYHSTTPSDYHFDGTIIDDKIWNEFGENLQGWSDYVVEVVRFTN